MALEKGTPEHDAWRKKLSDAAKNRVITEETREKLRVNNSGSNNPNYGKTHSNKTREKMSIGVKENKKPISEETRILLSQRKKEMWEKRKKNVTS